MLYNLTGCMLNMTAPMTELVSMPLFPLRTVLFPGMLLPLHIFEERYKTMIRECLEKEAAHPYRQKVMAGYILEDYKEF